MTSVQLTGFFVTKAANGAIAWTDEEDTKLRQFLRPILTAVNVGEERWEKVAKHFPGRNVAFIKNKATMIKAQIRCGSYFPFDPGCKVELREIFASQSRNAG